MENRLFSSARELFIFIAILSSIFTFNLFQEWRTYSSATLYPYHKTVAEVKSVNIRERNGTLYSAMEFHSIDGYRFYSSKHINTQKLESKMVEVVFDSSRLTFVDFLRGFRTRSFDIVEVSDHSNTIQKRFMEFIANQHDDESLKRIFVSLFFETRLPDDLQQKINEFGLSAVMSLSGLNLSLLVGLIFLVLSKPYRFVQDRYFPYRNRNLDIFVFALCVMFFYAYLAGFSKPFMRALVMAVFGLFLISRGIKIVNFTTLFVTLLIVVAIWPSAFFSIGLWLSVIGVYYIFLFLRHTPNLKIWQSYTLLSVFVFLAMGVVARYLFPLFSLAQLSSPLTSVLFDLFYPIEVVLHIFTAGWLFDGALIYGLELESKTLNLATPEWFFYLFLGISALAYFRLEAFWLVVLSATAFEAISIAVAVF